MISEASMVLLWRDEGQKWSTAQRVFTRDGDVPMFSFFAEHGVMQGRDRSITTFELWTYLDGVAFKYFFEKFTVNGTFSDPENDFSSPNACFVKFYQQKECQNYIREVTDAALNQESLLFLVEYFDHMHFCARLNIEGKPGFLRVTLAKILPMVLFAGYRGVSFYYELKRAIKYLDSGKVHSDRLGWEVRATLSSGRNTKISKMLSFSIVLVRGCKTLSLKTIARRSSFQA